MVDLLHSLLANIWPTFLVVLFFGGSIFVHELGHFLAARRRGVHVERFSIGFGPAIWSWRGKDGVEYRLAWFPLGGYVLLPQLADLGAIEGKSATRAEALMAKEAPIVGAGSQLNEPNVLPQVSYASKMLVFVAGATFNVLFAFILACILSVVGVPETSSMASTRIGYVLHSLVLPDGSKVTSPAMRAGLRPGDLIEAIDGHKVSNWADLTQTLATSTGRDALGQPRAIFHLQRDGRAIDVPVLPRLAGDDKMRQVGIGPAFTLIVYQVTPRSAADQAGFKAGDEIVSLGGEPMLNNVAFGELLQASAARPMAAVVRRDGRDATLTLPPRPANQADVDFGLLFASGIHLTHPSPFTQLWEQVVSTVHTLQSLINPRSDIGLSKLVGPVGIVRIFSSAAEAGLRTVLMFTILVNINLAILNLLPIPVLDGGQMLFATIGRLRGRALPTNLIATTQSVFIVLLFSMILYVTVFDVRRWVHDVQSDRAAVVEKH